MTGVRLLKTVSTAALLLSTEILASETPGMRRGPLAFQYAPSLSAEQLAWYSRFDVLVTHDPLPPAQVRVLKAAGTKLLFYEWSVAFYESRATPWQRSLLRSRKKTLLHERPLRGGVGSTTAAAWYFDPATATYAAARTAALRELLGKTGYDGVFFDTTRFESVHPQARETFERRHSGASYDAAFGEFLRELRSNVSLVFTNQGYREAAQYLPHASWDLTESLITTPVEGGVAMRPWNDENDPWNSIHFVLRTMIEPLTQHYPDVRFAHLNYIDAPGPEAIRSAVAIAQLFGGEAFVAAQRLDHEENEIYFRDPGQPLTPRIDWPGNHGAHRFFTNGLIAVSASAEAQTIPIEGRTLRNHLTGELACEGFVTIPPSPGFPRASFFDVTADCPPDPPDDSR